MVSTVDPTTPPASLSDGGGVQSVTGDLVDNADPLNPIINAEPTLSFSVLTRERIPNTGGISSDPLNPTYLTGLEISEQTGGFELVTTGPWANTGAVLNNTGEGVVIDMMGTFTFNPDNSGGASRVEMWSETSSDGITIIENDDSARKIEVPSAAETTGSKASRFTNVNHGDMIRFAFVDTGTGSVAFVPISVISTQGTVRAPSFSFQEDVVRRTPVS